MHHAILNTDPAHLTAALTTSLQHIATAPNVNPTAAKNLLTTISQISPQLTPIIGNLPIADFQQLRLICHNLLFPHNQTILHRDLHAHLSSLSRHAETNHLTEKAIAARRDKGLYDDSVIGQFIQGMLEEKYLAPVDAKYLDRGFKFTPPETDEYLQHMRNMHGGSPILTR